MEFTENLILAGVWQGSGKPPMKIIISKVLQNIDRLQTNGIPVHSVHFSGVKTVRAKLLMGVLTCLQELVQQTLCNLMVIILL